MTLAAWELLISAVALCLALMIAGYSWRRLPALSVAVVVWFGVAWALANNGFFRDPGGWQDGDLIGFLAFGTLMTLPMIALAGAWWQSAALRAFLDSIPLPALTAFQLYRVAGVVFLWLWAEGLMPFELGLPTGIADLSIGLLAIPVAVALGRRLRYSRAFAIAWNVCGIADFVVAVSIVSLSILGIISTQPDPVLIGLYPLALIALFQLPLSISLHAVALRRLLAGSAVADQVAGAVVRA